ncbi:MAG TPA: hypothetical protein VJ764_02545 [Steroidobacteraceae bacterium]|nr:hypothetical protein [Steroidobacteraceae bacterium]
MNTQPTKPLLLAAAFTLTTTMGAATANAQATTAPATICIALPQAQLGQGNNSPTDVSEPVRTALGTFMAGPAVQLVRLDARIPVQIDAEATQKGCGYVLRSAVTQKKGGGSFLKKMAPLAGALPMLGGVSGSMGSMVAAQAVSQAASTAAAQSMQEEAMAAMTGAQQSNVKSGDTITVEYALTQVGNATAVQEGKLQQKAKQNGEDLISPLLEQVATAVVTKVATTATVATTTTTE